MLRGVANVPQRSYLYLKSNKEFELQDNLLIT